jgi:hypothetical protein
MRHLSEAQGQESRPEGMVVDGGQQADHLHRNGSQIAVPGHRDWKRPLLDVRLQHPVVGRLVQRVPPLGRAQAAGNHDALALAGARRLGQPAGGLRQSFAHLFRSFPLDPGGDDVAA